MKVCHLLGLIVGSLFLGCEPSPESKANKVFSTEEIQRGVQLLPTYCNTCHGVGDREMDEMLSPPLWGIREHYLLKYPEPEPFVAAMVEFMQDPREDSVIMPIAYKTYGEMGTVSLSEADLRATAIAIYAGYIQRPPWARDYLKVHNDCLAE